MNKSFYTILLSLFSLGAYAQNNCIEPDLSNKKAITVLAKGTQVAALSHVLSKYCYNINSYQNQGMEIPTFYSTSISQFKILNPKDREFLKVKTVYGQNIVSEVLLAKLIFKPLDSGESKFMAETLKGIKVAESPYVSPSQEYVDYIINNYKSDLSTLSVRDKDYFGENIISYSIIGVSPTVLKNLSFSPTLLFVNNNYSVAPIHYLFAPHYTLNNDQYLPELNDFILSKVNMSTLPKLGQFKTESLSFFEYAYIMREYNPDLYAKLETRIKSRMRYKFLDDKFANKVKEKILKTADFKVLFDHQKGLFDKE